MTKVLIPLAQGCEELEAVTVIDLLRRAEIEVVTAGLESGEVICSRGVRLQPDINLDQLEISEIVNDFDMIVLPGGLPGANHLKEDTRVQSILRDFSSQEKLTAAICAAPRALASAGLLDNRKATSFPGALDDMQIPGLDYLSEPVVQDGTVITSRGPGTAMDFGLYLIEQLQGREKRQEVESALQRC